ncbi:MAG: GntR family transcriptional regulator [Armatimonadota bacterium]|nr:GntR family transcriptional regulator [Armatimonadota bacterium]
MAEVLREAILRNVLTGGQQLRQDEIAAHLGVSRIPVREALRQLEAEGLVTFFPHRGAVVSELSHQEVQEIYEIRIPLEATALRLALPRLTQQDLERAEAILEAIDRETEVAKWSGLNREFHTILYTPADRPRLLALINTLRTNVERYQRIYISLMQHKVNSQREHRQILEACRRRDVGTAVQALESHLGQAAQELVAYLRDGRDRRLRTEAKPAPR